MASKNADPFKGDQRFESACSSRESGANLSEPIEVHTLRPGMAADIVLFDPDTVRPLPESVVHDFPAGGWRVPAAGIYGDDRQR